MSVTEIARALNKNKHSVGHDLGLLLEVMSRCAIMEKQKYFRSHQGSP